MVCKLFFSTFVLAVKGFINLKMGTRAFCLKDEDHVAQVLWLPVMTWFQSRKNLKHVVRFAAFGIFLAIVVLRSWSLVVSFTTCCELTNRLLSCVPPLLSFHVICNC
jgi:hypothetical protein